jgi:hypothetical protein
LAAKQIRYCQNRIIISERLPKLPAKSYQKEVTEISIEKLPKLASKSYQKVSEISIEKLSKLAAKLAAKSYRDHF